MIAETEEDLSKGLNEWKNNVENRGMRENMNKTNVMLHRSETCPVRKENEVALQPAEMRVVTIGGCGFR